MLAEGLDRDESPEQCLQKLRGFYPTGITPAELATAAAARNAAGAGDPLLALATADVDRLYARRSAELGPEVLATWQVRVCLVPFDRQWSEHLAEMDALRDGIGLRAIGGRSPLAEYRREGAALFGSCQQEIRRKTVGTFFYAKITQAAEEARRVDIRARPHRSKQSRRRKP